MACVIILDDQKTNRSVLSRLATGIAPEIDVHEFPGAPDALDFVRRQVPDLVVTDYSMPEMNGAEFTRVFRTIEGCADVPVIVVTASEDRSLRYETLEAGATDFLESPIDHREFLVRARNLRALREHRLARESAERANLAKTAFLANMSHELRSPLNAINGFAEMMASEAFGPLGAAKYLEYAEDIRSSAQHLRNVIQNILDVSRIEQDVVAPDIQPVEAASLVDEAIRMMAMEAAGNDIALTRAPGGEGVVLNADRSKVLQVLLNLLSNGVKFTKPGGAVTVAVGQPPDGRVTIAVADTGIGMNRDEIVVARDWFGQVSSDPYAKSYQGAGLGLPLSIRLVELHGGSLDIQSEKGQGTKITLEFPAPATAGTQTP